MQRLWLTLLSAIFLMACTDVPLIERWALYYTPYTADTNLKKTDYVGVYDSKQQCQQTGVDQMLQYRGLGNFQCIVSFSHPSHPNHAVHQQ
jgi:hypothetical protein